MHILGKEEETPHRSDGIMPQQSKLTTTNDCIKTCRNKDETALKSSKILEFIGTMELEAKL